ncbi:MAG: 2-amino-4-hydroxy-6-hydroxymethyldihydropteridine diphosphokinase [Sedimentisphaerales bacterium]|nr:2-amino-4-hydroxy-6-hydroxymethyldihydropteridine diphosphokinase [Sedimentisphaerales bacterium]
MGKSTKAYIGIGSNLGDRRRYIESSVKMLAGAPELRLLRVSEVIESAPLLGDDQPSYLNAVAEVETELDAEGLLKTLGEIEILLGRVREERWGPRTIDLDLLIFGVEVVNKPTATVPHPQMHLRSFVLRGLCELDADLVHPVLGVTFGELAKRLNGGDFSVDPERPQLISVAGLIGVGKTTLAEKLAEQLGGEMLREPYDTNPHLAKVYAGQTELALDSELYFLNWRVEQSDRDSLTAGRVVVSDYVFERGLIFARRLLNTEQLDSYEKEYERMAGRCETPVLVIYLWDSSQVCLERIRNRNRPYEQRIQREYLDTLAGDYERLFAEWRKCPVIRLKSSELDYGNEATIERIVKQAKYYTAMHGVSAGKRA